MTWTHAPDLVATIRRMMLDSREIFVDYTMPLGLHHLIGGDHDAVMPENPDPRRADWSAVYYHRADASGIGFDRTRTGSGAVDQYRSPLREQWGNPAAVPEHVSSRRRGSRSRVVWTRDDTLLSPPGCDARRRTLPCGGTSASAISRRSARGRSRPTRGCRRGRSRAVR